MKLDPPRKDPYSSLNVALEKLREKGYDANFTVKDEVTLTDNNGNSYAPEDLVINEIHRITGEPERYSSKDRRAATQAIYALSSKNGEMGVLVNEFSQGGNDITDLFLQHVDRHDDLH